MFILNEHTHKQKQSLDFSSTFRMIFNTGLDFWTSVFSPFNSDRAESKNKRPHPDSVDTTFIKNSSGIKRQKLNTIDSVQFQSNSSNSNNLDTIHQVLLRRSPYFLDDTSDAEEKNTNPVALVDVNNIQDFFNNRRTYMNVPQYNLQCLNLTEKETLLYLIERNLSNSMMAPFDQYAYTKLTNNALGSTLPDASSFDKYNSLKIKKLDELSKTYTLNSRTYLKLNTFMPSAISAFLSPFFLEIFTVSDLDQLGSKCVNKMLNLRRTSTLIKKTLNREQLFENITQNLIWNIIALYKLKTPSGDNILVRMGLFNFYLSKVYMLTHLERLVVSMQRSQAVQSKIESYTKKINELKRLLPALLKALFKNGLFKGEDFHAFKRFCADKLASVESKSLEHDYYSCAIEQVSCYVELSSPLSLASVCRNRIRSVLNGYEANVFDQLELSKMDTSFLIFDEELHEF